MLWICNAASLPWKRFTVTLLLVPTWPQAKDPTVRGILDGKSGQWPMNAMVSDYKAVCHRRHWNHLVCSMRWCWWSPGSGWRKDGPDAKNTNKQVMIKNEEPPCHPIIVWFNETGESAVDLMIRPCSPCQLLAGKYANWRQVGVWSISSMQRLAINESDAALQQERHHRFNAPTISKPKPPPITRYIRQTVIYYRLRNEAMKRNARTNRGVRRNHWSSEPWTNNTSRSARFGAGWSSTALIHRSSV